MRMCVGNTTVPTSSPEEPPAASYATDRRSSPVSLTDERALPVSVVAEAGAQRGPRRVGPRQRVSRGPPFLGLARVGLSVVFLFCFVYLFHRFMYILKNM